MKSNIIEIIRNFFIKEKPVEKKKKFHIDKKPVKIPKNIERLFLFDITLEAISILNKWESFYDMYHKISGKERISMDMINKFNNDIDYTKFYSAIGDFNTEYNKFSDKLLKDLYKSNPKDFLESELSRYENFVLSQSNLINSYKKDYKLDNELIKDVINTYSECFEKYKSSAYIVSCKVIKGMKLKDKCNIYTKATDSNKLYPVYNSTVVIPKDVYDEFYTLTNQFTFSIMTLMKYANEYTVLLFGNENNISEIRLESLDVKFDLTYTKFICTCNQYAGHPQVVFNKLYKTFMYIPTKISHENVKNLANFINICIDHYNDLSDDNLYKEDIGKLIDKYHECFCKYTSLIFLYHE